MALTQILGQPTEGQISPTIRYTIVQLPNGKWCGMAKLQTAMGPVVIKAVADPNEEARALVRKMRASMAQGGAAAGFLGGLFKSASKFTRSIAGAARKIAQGRIVQRLSQTAQQVFANPAARKAVGLPPAAGRLVPQGLRAAGSLLNGARQRQPQAQRIVSAVVRQAKAGHPRARMMARYLVKARKIAAMRGWGAFAAPTYRRAGVAGEANGRWMTTAAGQVFVPHAYAQTAAAGTLELGDRWVGPLVRRLGFHAPYRGTGQVLTLREAYKSGLAASPR